MGPFTQNTGSSDQSHETVLSIPTNHERTELREAKVYSKNTYVIDSRAGIQNIGLSDSKAFTLTVEDIEWLRWESTKTLELTFRRVQQSWVGRGKICGKGLCEVFRV